MRVAKYILSSVLLLCSAAASSGTGLAMMLADRSSLAESVERDALTRALECPSTGSLPLMVAADGRTVATRASDILDSNPLPTYTSSVTTCEGASSPVSANDDQESLREKDRFPASRPLDSNEPVNPPPVAPQPIDPPPPVVPPPPANPPPEQSPPPITPPPPFTPPFVDPPAPPPPAPINPPSPPPPAPQSFFTLAYA